MELLNQSTDIGILELDDIECSNVNSKEQYAAEDESKFVPLASMDNHGAIHEEFADFIAATARIAEKRLLFISKVELHFKTLWSHVFSCSIIKLYYANICTLVQKLQN